MEGFSGKKLKKEDVNHAEKRVQEITGWSDPVEEKTGFIEVVCQNYEVLVEERRTGKTGGAGPSQRYDTLSGQKQNDPGASGGPDKVKKVGYRLSTEIKRTTDLRKVLEERILDNKVELSLREVLEIARKGGQSSIISLTS
mgnify:FL=1